MSDIPSSPAAAIGADLSAPLRGERHPLRASTIRCCYPGVTIASMTDRICAIALRERAFVWWWIAFVPCSALALLLVVSIL